MATVNRGIVVSAAIAASATSNTSPATVYTNPSSTAYAIVTVTLNFATGAAIHTVTVGGNTIILTNTPSASASATFAGIIIGPSQSLVYTNSVGSGNGNCSIAGVLLANSS